MKPAQTLGLVTLSIALAATAGQSQSTPTGTATSTTVPQGAVAPDSTPADKNQNNRQSGSRNRANRRAEQNSGRTGSATNTSPQESQYRQGSTANGTTVNSSNTTNYDVNSAVTAPTGAGSNPNNTGTTTPPNNSGSNNSISSGSNSGTSGSSANSGKEVSATSRAVTGARTSEKPAVKAGSTERNTSIHDYIASSPNHVTLQNALQSAGLYDMMKESGPYTLFAPTNAAFKKLPAAAQAGLLEGRNHDALKQLLSYHVVQGTVDAAELSRRIKAGNGKATLQTLAGTTLTAQTGTNGAVTLTDEQGKAIMIEDPDQYQANGVVHSVSHVLMPKSGTIVFR